MMPQIIMDPIFSESMDETTGQTSVENVKENDPIFSESIDVITDQTSLEAVKENVEKTTEGSIERVPVSLNMENMEEDEGMNELVFQNEEVVARFAEQDNNENVEV